MKVSELKGHFHAHVTYTGDQYHIPGWKPTIILLKGEEREQTDVMITRHFVLGKGGYNNINDIMAEIRRAGLSLTMNRRRVTRQKLEHENLPTLTPSDNNYRECHIKIRMPVDLVLDNPLKDFVESRNPMEVTDSHKTVFLNARYRYGKVHGVDTWCNAYAQLLKINNPQIEVLEVKLETTVYDSNIELDRWWA